MIYYFSGTGNSLWTANRLGSLLNEPVESLVKYQETGITCLDDVFGIVCPIYSWQIPAIVKDILEKSSVSKDSYVFLLMTGNNGEKNLGAKCPAFKTMASVMEHAGSSLDGVYMLQMPGNAIASTDEENERRLQEAPEKVEEIAADIQSRKHNYKPKKESLIYRIIKKRDDTVDDGKIEVMSKFTISQDCTGCGTCASICPMHNIQIVDGKAVHTDQCTTCLACMHWCPQHATVSRLSTLKNRKQYTHPEVSLEMILKANAA